jgi:hypothetical protein
MDILQHSNWYLVGKQRTWGCTSGHLLLDDCSLQSGTLPKAYPQPLHAVFDNPEACRFGRWCTNIVAGYLLADHAVGSGTFAIWNNVP